jgi:hypothetical protein
MVGLHKRAQVLQLGKSDSEMGALAHTPQSLLFPVCKEFPPHRKIMRIKQNPVHKAECSIWFTLNLEQLLAGLLMPFAKMAALWVWASHHRCGDCIYGSFLGTSKG